MSTRYHLDTEGWDTVVEMINWCIVDIDGYSWSQLDEEGVDPEEEKNYRELMEFRDRVVKLANRMGLTKEEVPSGTKE